MFGEGSNDTLIGDTGQNTLDGDEGIDTASYLGFANGALLNLGSGKTRMLERLVKRS